MQTSDLGTAPIKKILLKQSIPAAMGMLVVILYNVVDSIFVGRFVGTLGLAGTTVVFPLSMLISSTGMALGIGGSSIISRALGAKDYALVSQTFNHLITLTVIVSTVAVVAGYAFAEEILFVFGAKGDILPYALEYFEIIIVSVPFLAWAMMANNLIRSEGFARVSMYVMTVSGVSNMLLDYIFMVEMDMGIKGAAWATVAANVFAAVATIIHLGSARSNFKLEVKKLFPTIKLTFDICRLGSITLARQGAASVLAIAANHMLLEFGSELYIAVYGIINRVLIFALFPIIGIIQGALPIIGFNYGAVKYLRVKNTFSTAIIWGTITAVFFLCVLTIFPEYISSVFSEDQEFVDVASAAFVVIFVALPIVPFQMLSAGYFQAIGKAGPALFLTLSRQFIFLVPLVLILPHWVGIMGVWVAFPVADLLSMVCSLVMMRPEWLRLAAQKVEE